MPFPGLLNMRCMSGSGAGGWVLAGVSELRQRGGPTAECKQGQKERYLKPFRQMLCETEFSSLSLSGFESLEIQTNYS